MENELRNWTPEGIQTPFFSPVQRRNGGGREGIPCPFPSSTAAVSADSHPFARLPPRDFAETEYRFPFFIWRPKGIGGPGPRPLGAWASDPLESRG